jgi:pilus assembly protein CpaC
MKFSNLKSYLLALVLLLGASEMSMAQGAGEGAVRSPNLAAELDVPLYKSRILSLPDIADLLLLRSSELYVLGKDLGTTNVLLWDSEDRLVATVSVEVTHDLEGLKTKLHELMPNEAIEIRSAQRSIILSGTVSSPSNMTAAVAIAEGFLAQVATAKEKEMFEAKSRGGEEGSGRVINLMQVGGAQQVMLEVWCATGHARGQGCRNFAHRVPQVQHALPRDAKQQPLDDRRGQRRCDAPLDRRCTRSVI